MNVIIEQVQKVTLGQWSNIYEVTNSTIMRKWKWFFMNGFEFKSLIGMTISIHAQRWE